MSQVSFDDVMAKVPQLPALPKVVSRILASLDDEGANTEQLADLVASDPVVSVRVLAAANSAVFGGQSTTSVNQAIMRLGLARVRQVTVATALIDRFHLPLPFDNLRLWRHSVAVALCAESIAREVGAPTDPAWIAGLLHDIGQLLLFIADPYVYADVLRARTTGDKTLIALEQETFGLNHAQVGGELARRWNLPASIADAIGAHHARDEDTPDNPLADIVHAATALSHALDLDGTDWNRVPAVCDVCCARLGLDWRAMAPHFAAIEARYEGALLTLGL